MFTRSSSCFSFLFQLLQPILGGGILKAKFLAIMLSKFLMLNSTKKSNKNHLLKLSRAKELPSETVTSHRRNSAGLALGCASKVRKNSEYLRSAKHLWV